MSHLVRTLLRPLALTLSLAGCSENLDSPDSTQATAQALVESHHRHASRHVETSGWVATLKQSMPGTQGFTMVAAEFGLGPPCAAEKFEVRGGECKLYTNCLPASTLVSAGQVSVTGPTLTAVLAPDATHAYARAVFHSEEFQAGQRLSFDVAGSGDVGAFQRSLSAPGWPTVTRPQWLTGTAVPDGALVDRHHELELAWSPVAAADQGGSVMMVSMDDLDPNVSNASTAPHSLACTFPLRGGRGEIPAWLLSRLNAGGGYLALDARHASQVHLRTTEATLAASDLGPQGVITLQ